MLTFFIVLIGLSLLILGHEAGHFFAAKKFGLKVDEFGIGFPPRLWSWRKGETTYSVNWLPFGGFVKIAGEEMSGELRAESGDQKKHYFFAQPVWKRAIVTGAGVGMNFVLGWLLIALVFMIGTPKVLIVGKVDPNSPAAMAGLAAGDVIKNFQSADEFIYFIQSNLGKQMEFAVARGGENLVFKVEPQSMDGRARIGVSLEEGGAARMNPLIALGKAFQTALKVCWLTVIAFFELVRNLLIRASLLEGVVGPVGIFAVAKQTSYFGFVYLVQLLGIISLNLTVANLLPFPALDGGRLFLLLAEKIKGSPVSKRVEGFLNSLGFAFLIVLMLLVTIRDISQWFK